MIAQSNVLTRLQDVSAASAALLIDQIPRCASRSDRGFEPLQHALEATLYAFCESASITPCNSFEQLVTAEQHSHG
jgi:hypothetical protein